VALARAPSPLHAQAAAVVGDTRPGSRMGLGLSLDFDPAVRKRHATQVKCLNSIERDSTKIEAKPQVFGRFLLWSQNGLIAVRALPFVPLQLDLAINFGAGEAIRIPLPNLGKV
jgi:hypothetical protein